MYEKRFMDKAIQLAIDNANNGTGGPFGAVVVKDGEIISACGNTVTTSNDSTAHAEINAIREACTKLSSFQLTGCEIYASCEPCPMCLGAIYWARPDKVYYASNQHDAAAVGFDDSFIYKEIELPYQKRSIPFIQKSEPLAGKEFQLWKESSIKEDY